VSSVKGTIEEVEEIEGQRWKDQFSGIKDEELYYINMHKYDDDDSTDVTITISREF